MPNLRDYRDRIKSVTSTRKITSAMKMVAASKLRRAQEQAEASQPYARSMAGMLSRLSANVVVNAASPKLLAGTGADQKHLIVVVTADRGLCGGFNSSAVKKAREQIYALQKQGKDVSIICVGRKGYDLLSREFGVQIIHSFKEFFGKKGVEYADANAVCEFILTRFEAGEFDICSLVYNDFRSILVQEPSSIQLIPFRAVDEEEVANETDDEVLQLKSPYSFEPTEEEILAKLLPRNLGVQIFRSMLDSAAGEQAARMTAMDNATRNAGDMINDLTLRYNRARQAYITKELIEIISGSEALQ
ncbi:MAG: F0F1 ATP synthase subunit gamma [Zetaproteobacteria bacterium]|nr:MAG: F0F1 ATP synthase subunit gamma [Zetaproteobacteria bacterium]